MPEVKLTAESRTEFGKGAARRLRRAHKIPAVLYGHGTDPVHVALPGHATMLALKHSNTLLTLDLGNGTTQLALPKDVQRNPVRNEYRARRPRPRPARREGDVDVPVHVTGEPAGDGLTTLELTTLSLEVEATAIPQAVEISVDGAEEGTQIHAREVALPDGAVLITDPEALVVVIATAGVADTGDEGAPEGDVVEEPAGETAGEG